MIIIITLAALMLAVTLTACIKPGKAENIVDYGYSGENAIDQLVKYLNYLNTDKESEQ
jgi:hypothetical protein